MKQVMMLENMFGLCLAWLGWPLMHCPRMSYFVHAKPWSTIWPGHPGHGSCLYLQGFPHCGWRILCDVLRTCKSCQTALCFSFFFPRRSVTCDGLRWVHSFGSRSRFPHLRSTLMEYRNATETPRWRRLEDLLTRMELVRGQNEAKFLCREEVMRPLL